MESTIREGRVAKNPSVFTRGGKLEREEGYRVSTYDQITNRNPIAAEEEGFYEILEMQNSLSLCIV